MRFLPCLLALCVSCCSLASCVSAQASAPAPLSAAAVQQRNLNDVKTLNYALTLEHLEANFYNVMQAQFSAADFTAAGVNARFRDYLTVIRDHENAHVGALSTTITSLGGTPVQSCNYNFSAVTNVRTYLSVAALLEATGVSAYTPGLAHLSSTSLQEVAASIATVEARHASFLNTIQAASPFPDATDSAVFPRATIAAASSFFKDCQGSTDLSALIPTVRPYGATGATGSAKPAQFNNIPMQSSYSAQQKSNDLKALNYALVLEHLEAAFYNTMQQRFNSAQFQSAGFTNDDYQYFELIKQHENAHVSSITDTIRSYGGTPVPDCTYNFAAVNNVTAYLATAKLLENTGASAYTGAADTFTDVVLQTVAATVATVEGRHAAYLNYLVDSRTANAPFPTFTETVLQPAQVIAAATPFFASCPFNLADPSILPVTAPAPLVAASTPTPSPSPAPASPADSAAASTAPAVYVSLALLSAALAALLM